MSIDKYVCKVCRTPRKCVLYIHDDEDYGEDWQESPMMCHYTDACVIPKWKKKEKGKGKKVK